VFEQVFRNIDDVLRKEAGCTTELDYTEQTSWLLFLKYLDALEQDRARSQAGGKEYTYILEPRTAGRAGPRPRERRRIDHNAR
jgi:type I restriction enzyme M protein